MTVTFNQFRYFCTLAETLHFGQAAERLGISQPPLSRQIALLEENLGAELFIRGRKGVSLTAAGRQLLDDSRDVLRLADQATRNVVATSRGQKGGLSVGFTMCAAYSVVPQLTMQYMQRFPEVTLSVREMLPNVLETELKEGKIDFAITFPDIEAKGSRQYTLSREPMNLVVPQDHRLSQSTRVSIADLRDENFICVPREQAPHLHDGIVRRCQADGFAPKVALEVYLQQTIINFVAAGLGVAFVPESMRLAHIQGAAFKNVRNAPMVEQVLAWRAANRNPCMPGFLEVAKDVSGTSRGSTGAGRTE
ncbi:LysR family transcriptional regulator [Methylobacterium mesophilicum SR1.6/6]|uniref:LysR family transcriptional regulator n=1 Tax=Methylobacterium mesophilicum SR1.6/6 TaxID=908290 RepID=A0A6B9FRH3_9HYPH|nr:LysR family transcriptional regulator [Methylobacterium mesophilicum]QGY03604.1 LysR family transcriptional regulator [Methylobacterium mesophilicum SR1.6/6]